MTNPFLTEWDTPHGMPPFAEISVEDYEEAFEQAFAQRLQEIEVIASATDAPSFENTIEAMERSGQLLERVAGVFFNLTSSDTSEQLQAVETRIMPDYAAHFSEIFTNQALFQRVRSVQEGADALQTDQRRLVIDIYTRFVRAGAALEVDARQSVKQIDEELATLETQFGQSVLNDTNDFELVLDDADELSGLPDSVLQVAAAEAGIEVVDATLSFATITAPFDGVVTVRHREPGETAPPGAPVLTLMNPDDRWVRIYVPEDRIGRVTLGQTANITSDSYPDRTHEGRVTFIASEAEFTPKNVQMPEERVKLVYAVKVQVVGDPSFELKPGMPADVRLDDGDATP